MSDLLSTQHNHDISSSTSSGTRDLSAWRGSRLVSGADDIACNTYTRRRGGGRGGERRWHGSLVGSVGSSEW